MINLNEIFRKDGPYDNIKIHKKPGFHPLFRGTTKKCENKNLSLFFSLRPGSGWEGLNKFKNWEIHVFIMLYRNSCEEFHFSKKHNHNLIGTSISNVCHGSKYDSEDSCKSLCCRNSPKILYETFSDN